MLRLESATDSLDLSGISRYGKGVEATAGATGFGLPPVALQWIEGVGDGAIMRSRRVLSRDIDLELHFLADNRAELRVLYSHFARMVAGPCRLVYLEEDTGLEWWTTVHRTGGGTFATGTSDLMEREASTAITFRTTEPYFTATLPQRQTITTGGPGLLPRFSRLPLSASRALGALQLVNNGDADAHLRWTLYGPGNNFKAVSQTGEVIHWTGSLGAGQRLTIDTRDGIATDSSGNNRYADFAKAPRFWTLPPGTSTAEVTFEGTSPGASLIDLEWHPRRWVMM